MNLLNLNLKENAFSGTLPASLALAPLSSLRFAVNFLHGTIPGEACPEGQWFRTGH